jgi:outer membrane lipoprotein SlyB
MFSLLLVLLMMQLLMEFEATGDNFGSSENMNLASGKVYKINNTEVLNATTLGSAVVNSSLTSVGTLDELVVSGVTTSSGGFSGNLTGNVTGNVTGNLTGDVTGDVTGNADTATTLETARTIQFNQIVLIWEQILLVTMLLQLLMLAIQILQFQVLDQKLLQLLLILLIVEFQQDLMDHQLQFQPLLLMQKVV